MTERFSGSHSVPHGSFTSEPLAQPGSPSPGALRAWGGGTGGEARRGLSEPESEFPEPPSEVEQWRPIGDLPGYDVSDRGRVRTWHGKRGSRRERPKLRKLDRDRWGCTWLHLGGAANRRRVLVANLVRRAFPELGPAPASDDLLGAIDRARSELKAATLESLRRGDTELAGAFSRLRDLTGRLGLIAARNMPEAAP